MDTLESWTLLTALATATSRIRLGQLVGCNPFRHPAVLAKMAATVDQISGGRLDLGLGWGSVDEELAAFGFDGATRRERAEALGETLEILALMFEGEPFDYSGRHLRLRGAYGRPTPMRKPLPIHIGGGGRVLTMPLAGRYAHWWNRVGSARDRLEQLAPLRGKARISAQYAVGLAPTAAACDEVAVVVARRMPASAWGPRSWGLRMSSSGCCRPSGTVGSRYSCCASTTTARRPRSACSCPKWCRASAAGQRPSAGAHGTPIHAPKRPELDL